MKTFKRFSLLLLAVSALALSACSSGASEQAPQPLQATLAEDFSDLDAIAKVSTLVVHGTALPNPESTDGSIPFTTTKFKVLETLKGEVSESEIYIFQTGNQQFYVEGLAPVIKPDSEYILYLRQYEGETKYPGNTYTVTGVGAYEKSGSTFLLDELAEAEPGVDTEISLTDAVN